MGNLTTKQQMFIDHYLSDPELNATKAYMAAYPSSSLKAAESGASRLLSNAKVTPLIAKAMEERSERTKIDKDYVLNRLVQIDQMDVLDILADDGSFKGIGEWPLVWRQYVSGIDVAELWEGRGDQKEVIGVLKKIKWPDKVKNLELLGKHVGVQAFKEQVEHSGGIETIQKVDLASVSKEDRSALKALLEKHSTTND